MTKEITIRKGGESRTFTLLPREQIEKTIKEADPWEIVARAHSEYIPGFKDGIVAVDLVTGRIVSYGLAPNEELHPFDSVEVVIYTLENNITLEDIVVPEKVLSEERLAEFEGSEYSLEEFEEAKGINLMLKEWFIDELVSSYQEEADIEQKLDEWYYP